MKDDEKENNSKSKLDSKLILILVLLLIIIALVLFIVFSKSNNDLENDNASSNDNISKIEDNTTNSNVANETNNNVINKIETKESKNINYNETVTKEEKYELTMKTHRFGKTIEPPNTSGYYRYYDASEGHQYLEIVFDYKNLTTSVVRADNISSIKIKYNDKYEYSGFAVIEDSDGDFTYANITSIAALSTGKMHYLIEVPDEVAKDTGSIVATVKCGQDEYKLNIR